MRVALIIGVWMLALTAGALLYIAKQRTETELPVSDAAAPVAADAAAAPSVPEVAPPAADMAPVSFTLPDIGGAPTAALP